MCAKSGSGFQGEVADPDLDRNLSWQITKMMRIPTRNHYPLTIPLYRVKLDF